MTDWASVYTTDIGYTYGYFNELSVNLHAYILRDQQLHGFRV